MKQKARVISVAMVMWGAALAACSDEDVKSVEADAGTDMGSIFADASVDAITVDAGTDLGSIVADASVDASTVDAALDANPDAGPDAFIEPAPVLEISFEDEVPAPVSTSGECAATLSQGYEPLGPEGNRFGPTFLRCVTGGVVTVTLPDLPPHTSLSVDFLLAAIDSLDGEGTFPAGDYFRVDVDGITVFRETFANALESQVQTFEPSAPEVVLVRRMNLGFSGPGGYYTDSAYDMSLESAFDDIPHSASSAVVTFTLEGAGVQSLDDESWAIDNVRILVGDP